MTISAAALSIISPVLAASAQGRPTASGVDSAARADSMAEPPVGRWGFGPVQFRALLHVDYATGSDARAQLPGPGEGFALRRARLIVQGAAPLGLGYGLQLEASQVGAGSSGSPAYRGAPLVEAYLDYRIREAVLVRVGQQRVPFGLNSTTAAPTMPTPEFAQFARSLQQRVSAFRDIGVTAQGRLGLLEYAGGVFNGGGINVLGDNDSTRDVAGRLSYTVIPGLTLGASGWMGHSPDAHVRPGETGPAVAFHDDADFRRYGVDARWSRGPLLLTVEYAHNRTEHAPEAMTPTPDGVSIDQAGWNAMGAMRLGVLHPTLRRLELVGRYDEWDPNEAVREDEITEIVAGVNVHLAEVNEPSSEMLGRVQNFVRRSSKLMLFVEHSRFGRGSAGGAAPALPARNTRLHARWALFY